MAVVGRWSPCLKTKPMQEDAKRKRLLAAAAAYVAVHFRGRLLVVLKEDAVTLGRKTRGWGLAAWISMDVGDVSWPGAGSCYSARTVKVIQHADDTADFEADFSAT